MTIDWGACPIDGFVAWRVVRSLDGNPTWPMGDGDQLVAGSESQALRSVQNGDLPAGRTVYYRVVGLGRQGDETVVRCRSRIADIHVPAADPTPAPTTEPDPIGSIGDVTRVVRSSNDGVSFPLGSGDSYAGVFGKDGPTSTTDTGAAAGRSYWYRVFCLRQTGDGYRIVAISPIRKVTTPAAEPQPEPSPVGLDLSVELTDGGVALHWGACSNDHFVAYKVIRSAGENPSYLPATEGSVVIAVKENAGVLSFTDPNVESGQTWRYRVQCIGWMNDHRILLGETDVATVTLP